MRPKLEKRKPYRKTKRRTLRQKVWIVTIYTILFLSFSYIGNKAFEWSDKEDLARQYYILDKR